MSESFAIKVRQHGAKQVELRIHAGMLVSDLKQLISQHFDAPPQRQKLIAQGKLLRDTDTVQQAQLQEGFVVQLIINSAEPQRAERGEDREAEDSRQSSSM